MRYLLDVNVLIALGFVQHQFRDRVIAWVSSLSDATLLTCSITELGFVRILSQVPESRYSVEEARGLLLQMKKNEGFPFLFLADGNDISQLPSWVKTAKQTTDGHLLQLASAHGAVLATLDERIPGAHLIP